MVIRGEGRLSLPLPFLSEALVLHRVTESFTAVEEDLSPVGVIGSQNRCLMIAPLSADSASLA